MQINRTAIQQRYREAEWLNAWAVLYGADNRQHDLNDSRAFVADDVQRIESLCKEVIADSLAFLTDLIAVPREIDIFDAGSVALMALNPSGWERADVIYLAGDPLELIDPDPTVESPINQTVFDEQGRIARLYEVTVPAYGYRVFRTRKGLPGRMIDNPLQASRRSLESATLRITFDEHGEIESLYDKEADRELVLAGTTINQLIVGNESVRTVDSWQVTESGPLRANVQIVKRIGQCLIDQHISVWRHTRRIDIHTTISGADPPVSIQADFPFPENRPVVLFNDGDRKVISRDHMVSLSLINGTDDPTEQEFTYSLYPYKGDPVDTDLIRRAAELNTPLRAIRFRPADSGDLSLRLPPIASLITIDNPDVTIDTLRIADDGDGLIVQLSGQGNVAKSVAVSFAEPVIDAAPVDLFEQPIADSLPEIENGAIRFTIQPNEQKYLRVRLKHRNVAHE